MCQAALPAMVDANYGRIINIADSGADALSAAPNVTPYIIGKTGVLILTRSLARHYAQHNITVNAISPGILENSVTKPRAGTAAIPKQRYTRFDDVTAAMRFLLLPETDHITGANIPVAGGWGL